MHQLLYMLLITLYSCNQTVGYNRTVGCNRIVEAANHTKSTQLNPPVTELTTITIETTTYPEKKIGKISTFFALDTVPTGDVCPKCNFFRKL